MAREIGTVTAAAALRDELEELLAGITGLSVRAIRRRLNAVRGNRHVRNVLSDAWPWAAERLGRIRVAVARDQGLVAELVHVTGLSSRGVRRRLNSENGRKLLQNAFADRWPAAEDDVRWGSERERPAIEDGALGDSSERASRRPDRRAFDGARIADRYVLGERLGRGGFGEVFEAWDELTDRLVVLKFANNDDIEVLKREFGKVFDLSHRHICRVSLQLDQLTGRAFLVMPHAGRSIEQQIRQRGPLTVEDSIAIVAAIAEALDFAHEHHVIHHDVSPGNILVHEETGAVRLTDFGVAVVATRRMTTQGGETLMGATMVGLNRGYAAPEMYVGQARRASDQFSLAHVFGAMVDGKLYHRPPEFKARRRLSKAQNRALERATHIDPRQRFASCGEFAATLAGTSARPGSISWLS